jgi:hypothetical protein
VTVEPGLCGTCRNARVIQSKRGSTFLLCELSAVDDRFPKYPPLPVLACIGWVPRDGA